MADLPFFTSGHIDEFAAQTHVMFGLPGCATCGSLVYGSTLACWNCLEQEISEQASSGQEMQYPLANLAERISARSALLTLLRPPQLSPQGHAQLPQRRVFRWSYSH